MELHDLYMSALVAERYHGLEGSGRADVSFGFADPVLANGRLSILSGVTVTLIREVDGADVASIRSDYVAVMKRDSGEWDDQWESEVSRADLARFAFGQLYTRHRERLMEATLRMGLPIFKLELVPPMLEDEQLFPIEPTPAGEVPAS